MMRSFSKLQRCVAAATLMFLYFVFYQHSMGFGSAMHNYSAGTTLRIVVFGDDWSDTGSYRTFPPPYLEVAARDAARGDLWAETLCKKVSRCPDQGRNRLRVVARL
jgi:hypothetical protein